MAYRDPTIRSAAVRWAWGDPFMIGDPIARPASEKEVRAAQLAHVLARGVRDGEMHAVDARRVVLHELRKLNTNKAHLLPIRSVEAQRVIERYAALGQPVPKNSSDEALHADHVYKFTAETLTQTDTVEAWLSSLVDWRWSCVSRPARTTSWKAPRRAASSGRRSMQLLVSSSPNLRSSGLPAPSRRQPHSNKARPARR